MQIDKNKTEKLKLKLEERGEEDPPGEQTQRAGPFALQAQPAGPLPPPYPLPHPNPNLTTPHSPHSTSRWIWIGRTPDPLAPARRRRR